VISAKLGGPRQFTAVSLALATVLQMSHTWPTLHALHKEKDRSISLARELFMDSLERDAARIALLALRASVESGNPQVVERLVVSPSREPLTVDQTVEVLASIGKPVDCGAEQVGDTLVMNCRQLSSNAEILDRQAVASALLGDYGPGVAVRAEPTGTQNLILLRTAHDSLVVSIDAFNKWTYDYSLPLGLGLTIRPPRPDEQSPRVVCVVLMGKPKPMDPQVILDSINPR
jgi:hypothetical protein